MFNISTIKTLSEHVTTLWFNLIHLSLVCYSILHWPFIWYWWISDKRDGERGVSDVYHSERNCSHLQYSVEFLGKFVIIFYCWQTNTLLYNDERNLRFLSKVRFVLYTHKVSNLRIKSFDFVKHTTVPHYKHYCPTSITKNVPKR